MGKLTTHVLDTATGQPAAGMHWILYRIDDSLTEICRGCTNADGRNDGPVLEGTAFNCAIYEFHFDAGGYFRNLGIELADPAFLDTVVIRFGIAQAQANYHVPLLVSPYGYSTYRGS
jgi:5-hydroxyisourate hydrolase